jgi:uncharacterized protein (TIGR02452 family)
MKFDHVGWLESFNADVQAGNWPSIRTSRASIFHGTVEIVTAGRYDAGGFEAHVPNEDVAAKTEFFIRPDKLSASNDYDTTYSVIDADCLETAELLLKSGLNPCVLNMASRRNPGGGVIKGSGAQEENIFRRTNIFLSMYRFAQYAKEYGLEESENQYPLDRDTGGIYSGGITVFRGSEKNGYRLLRAPFEVAFVSVPAINRPALERIHGEYRIDSSLVEPTREKIRTLLRIAGKYRHDSLVLSAFGCGAFRNPSRHVARLFREVFSEGEFSRRFKTVVFSIIDDHNSRHEYNPAGNVLPFLEVFDCRNRFAVWVALRRYPDWDRQMSEILSAIPTYGMEAVEWPARWR